MEKVEKILSACTNLEIKLFIGTDAAQVSSDEFNSNILTILTGMPITDTVELCNLLMIQTDCNVEVNFNVNRLRYETESSCQEKYLTPYSKIQKHILDTHLSNAIAQNLCVSPANNGVISFNAKPDLVNGLLPMVLEIKSRVVATGKDVTKDQGKKGPRKEVTKGDNRTDTLLSSAVGNLSLESDSLNLVTMVEYALFQQSVERVLEQAQFRAYLSKFVVLASTGYVSWCYYYTQSLEESSFEKKLRIMRISNADVNTVWNGMTAAVRVQGDSFYLTKHGHIIANTLQSIYPRLDIHSIRVHVAGMSRSVVYYVTPPFALVTKRVNIAEKSYALKVVADISSFEHEIQSLKRVEEVWINTFPNQKFYYVTNSNMLHPTWSEVQQYSWLVAHEVAVSDPQYGVIVMLPATKKLITQEDDADGNIFGQLLRCLSVAHHAGVLHCDLSPSNCLQFFDDSWQVVDYGLSGFITNRENGWFTNHSGKISVQKGSNQHKCCGRRAFDIVQENDFNVVEIDWTVGDDIDMLYRTCQRK